MSHSHHHHEIKTREARHVTLVGAVLNLVLAVLKIIFGHLGNSAALFADGIHSLSDLASDALVLVASKHGNRPADDDHPYGHGRIETAATVVLGLMLAVVAVGIGWDAVIRIQNVASLSEPTLLVVVIAAASLASKEWLYQYTTRVAKRIRSRLLEANAWHHRTDAISSFFVLLGVAGAMAGLPVLDAVTAILVAVMIGHIAWELIHSSVMELIDTAVDEEIVQEIREVITNTDGVLSLHLLRTRRMGPAILVDAHIQVQPRLSVSEGHQIADIVREQLTQEQELAQDVTIHIDPENDEEGPVNAHLPLRHEVLEALQAAWNGLPQASEIRDITLHYLDGQVEVEILLPLPEKGTEAARQIQQQFSAIASGIDTISAIRVAFE